MASSDMLFYFVACSMRPSRRCRDSERGKFSSIPILWAGMGVRDAVVVWLKYGFGVVVKDTYRIGSQDDDKYTTAVRCLIRSCSSENNAKQREVAVRLGAKMTSRMLNLYSFQSLGASVSSESHHDAYPCRATLARIKLNGTAYVVR